MICDRVKEIVKLQNNIELNELSDETKSGKHKFNKVSLPIIFSIDIFTNVVWIKDLDKEQSKLFKELSDISKVEKPIEKKRLL